jgi:hypothetical protein
VVIRGLAVLGWMVAFTWTAAWGQNVESPPQVMVDPTAANEPSADATVEPGEGANRGGGAVTPLVAPLPFRNSQIGWGLALMVGLIHRFDPDTTIKPSTGAITGLVSENGSWGVLGLEIARFGRDAWRARGVAGYMDLRYDFYGVGIDAGEAGQSIPIEQTIFLSSGALLRRVVPGLYIGPTFLWMQTTVSPRDEEAPDLPVVPDQSRSDLLAPGLLAEWDTRNSDYWPDRGSLAQLKANFFSTASGESGSFQRYQAAWSWYNGLRGQRLVLVTNLNACGAPGDARSMACAPSAPVGLPFVAIPRGATGTTTRPWCRRRCAVTRPGGSAPRSSEASARWPRKSRTSSMRRCSWRAARDSVIS